MDLRLKLLTATILVHNILYFVSFLIRIRTSYAQTMDSMEVFDQASG